MNKTQLNNLHHELGGKMVEFAGYEMPIQFEGIKAEHLWVRSNTGLFDVSHMGQAILECDNAIEIVESITPSPFAKTPIGKAKYTVLIDNMGGIIDDLIITKLADNKFFFVYNAACRAKDETFILSKTDDFHPMRDHALIAVQGAQAESILSSMFEIPTEYMTIKCNDDVFISRLGYTGEDGFEISIPSEQAESFAREVLKHPEVKPIGLGARDSLRLEMGYPLYGHDISNATTPIAANLKWVVAKAKREEFATPKQLRVGIEILDRAPAREGTKIFSLEGKEIGVITSGGFSPTLEKPIAQGYIDIAFAEIGTEIELEVRGRKISARVHELNFIEAKTI